MHVSAQRVNIHDPGFIIVADVVIVLYVALRVNHHDFMALHSMWRIFWKANICLSIE